LSEGWPDFWIRGKKIDLIDLVDTINLIKQINTINTVNNLGTLNTLNTIETIQKINPKTIDTTEYNTVIDLIEKIQQIDNISNLSTLNTINTVETINTINLIKALYNAEMRQVGITNGDFETGDLTGWFTRYVNSEYGTAQVTDEQAFHGDYSCKFTVASPKGANTPEINQLLILPPSLIERIDFYWLGEPGTRFWAGVVYTDSTADNFYFDAPTLYIWQNASILGSQLNQDKTVMLIAFGPANETVNEGKTFYLDAINVTLRVPVYQVEKDRTISREGSITHFNVSASAAGSTTIYTPSSGKKAKVLAWNLYCDADVICELRFSTSGNVIAGLPSKGATAMNLIGCTAPTGDTDETIEIYVSDAANIKGWICVQEV